MICIMPKKFNDSLPHVVDQEEYKMCPGLKRISIFLLAWSYHTMKIINEGFLLSLQLGLVANPFSITNQLFIPLSTS